MAASDSQQKIAQHDLEDLLSLVLVPVEPREKFIQGLKAKLISYQGGRRFSLWMAVGTIAMVLLILLTWLGLLLRIVLVVIDLLGGIFRRQRKSEVSTISL
ncbi:MAG: hypothetical protein GTO18_02085 [Anaerolineales bacterium]|nr:hypothetical protein [Anaerolineales bacterium]